MKKGKTAVMSAPSKKADGKSGGAGFQVLPELFYISTDEVAVFPARLPECDTVKGSECCPDRDDRKTGDKKDQIQHHIIAECVDKVQYRVHQFCFHGSQPPNDSFIIMCPRACASVDFNILRAHGNDYCKNQH